MIGVLVCTKTFDQSRFATAVLPDQRVYLARLDLQGYILEARAEPNYALCLRSGPGNQLDPSDADQRGSQSHICSKAALYASLVEASQEALPAGI